MNANDARITRVYTAQTGSVVEDPAPNAPGPAANFDLIFQSEAGNSIGSGGGDYVLTITAYDVTTGDNNTDMTVGPLNEKFNSTFDWTASAPDFFTKGYGSSWIFESCLTCANALRRVQHPGFSLVTGLPTFMTPVVMDAAEPYGWERLIVVK
jgi:hypothetical protein